MTRNFDELKRELLDHRLKLVDWWLTATAIFLTSMSVFLTFFAIVIAIFGYFGFQKFSEIEKEARQHMEVAERYAKTTEEYKEKAKHHYKQIETIHASTAKLSFEDVPTETTHSDTGKASEVVEAVQQNPTGSLIDRAIAGAVSLQQQGKTKEAIAKWRSIANIVEGVDRQLQARAWLSAGHLYGKEGNWKAALDAYNEAIRLNKRMAIAYVGRGTAEWGLGRREAALADYNEAIRLNKRMATAYAGQGAVKEELGRLNEAREDFQKALAFAQESGDEDLIAMVQNSLSQLDNDQAP